MLSPGYRRKTSLEAGLCGHLKELSEPVVFLEDHSLPHPLWHQSLGLASHYIV